MNLWIVGQALDRPDIWPVEAWKVFCKQPLGVDARNCRYQVGWEHERLRRAELLEVPNEVLLGDAQGALNGAVLAITALVGEVPALLLTLTRQHCGITANTAALAGESTRHFLGSDDAIFGVDSDYSVVDGIGDIGNRCATRIESTLTGRERLSANETV